MRLCPLNCTMHAHELCHILFIQSSVSEPSVSCSFSQFMHSAMHASHAEEVQLDAWRNKELCVCPAGKQHVLEQKDSALDATNVKDVEKALPIFKTHDSAADLAQPADSDPAKSVIYQHRMADQNAPQRSVKLDKNQRMFWGIGVASIAGIVGSLFSPGFNVVTNDAFHTLAPGVEPLTVYTG